ncbi:MAG TPA: hypothetical protein VEU62_14270 [Bryobacterales bacterium]|nr:hypothetical protein [Bryobacterales bacterium]
MRFLLWILCVASWGSAYCQDASSRTEKMIEQIIVSGAIDGWTDKQLSRMGDAAAVAVTKLYGEKQFRADDVDGVLVVIHLSFSAPGIVETVSDREPRTTLFVLRYLDSFTADPTLKRRIAEERRYVLQQFAKPRTG